MMEECRKFIRWMMQTECSSHKNSGYVPKCDCQKDIREDDITEVTEVVYLQSCNSGGSMRSVKAMFVSSKLKNYVDQK